jgi:hypothetical protein
VKKNKILCLFLLCQFFTESVKNLSERDYFWKRWGRGFSIFRVDNSLNFQDDFCDFLKIEFEFVPLLGLGWAITITIPGHVL